MNLSRRKFLAGIGTGAVCTVAGVSQAVGGNFGSDDEPEPVPNTDLSPQVRSVRPLAGDFAQKITQHYKGVSIYLTRSGEVLMEYSTSESTSEGLQAEFGRISKLFASTVEGGDHPATSLTVVVGEVQAVVPEPAVKAYVDERLNDKAYLETIEVRSIERRGSD